MTKIIAVALLSLISSFTQAADITYIPSVSHFKETNQYGQKWNSQTKGIKLELDNGFTIGTMKNSYFKQSTFAGYAWRPIKVAGVEAGVIAALASGYNSDKMATKTPVVAVGTLKMNVAQKYHVELLVAPTVRNSSGWVAVGFGFNF